MERAAGEAVSGLRDARVDTAKGLVATFDAASMAPAWRGRAIATENHRTDAAWSFATSSTRTVVISHFWIVRFCSVFS
jgi:hypothetical protein